MDLTPVSKDARQAFFEIGKNAKGCVSKAQGSLYLKLIAESLGLKEVSIQDCNDVRTSLHQFAKDCGPERLQEIISSSSWVLDFKAFKQYCDAKEEASKLESYLKKGKPTIQHLLAELDKLQAVHSPNPIKKKKSKQPAKDARIIDTFQKRKMELDD